MNLPGRNSRIMALLAGLVWVLPAMVPARAAADFIVGADVSLLPFFESNGIAYKVNGQAQDPEAAWGELRPSAIVYQQRRASAGGPLQLRQQSRLHRAPGGAREKGRPALAARFPLL
jgi:hypothetical protein